MPGRPLVLSVQAGPDVGHGGREKGPDAHTSASIRWILTRKRSYRREGDGER